MLRFLQSLRSAPAPKMPVYPGLGLDLRHHDQRNNPPALYPIGVHENCFGSYSEMLPVREVAMMIVMEQLTDKPDFHLKVFDDTITERWIEEALAIPVDDLYNDIVRGKFLFESDPDNEIFEMSRRQAYPKQLTTILDRGCLNYVRHSIDHFYDAFTY